MKTTPAAILACLFLAIASCATNPSYDQSAALHREQVASFIARVAYAKANAAPRICDTKGGRLSCMVYTVTQGADGAPGYTMVTATDRGPLPMNDLIALCDTATIDPAHSVQCAGHVLSVQSGWITTCGDAATLTLGLGKGDTLIKITGPRKSEPM